MTISEAEAILEAERALQHSDSDGPDWVPGTAWYGLVTQAVKMYDMGDMDLGGFNDVVMVQQVRQ
jgi:hypothetical protein